MGCTRCAPAYAVRTGVVSNSENGAVSTSDQPIEIELARAIVAWLQEDGTPASWLCAEGPARPESARALKRLGCEPERDAWEMSATLSNLDLTGPKPPAGTSIATVQKAGELEAWLDVAGACGWFDSPAERAALSRLYHGLGLDDTARVVLHVAYTGDRPVGMASSFYGEQLALLTAVGVIPEARRQGIGRQLASTRLHEAQQRGCTTAVLAPSPDGARLYEALGFQTQRQPEDRWFFVPQPNSAG